MRSPGFFPRFALSLLLAGAAPALAWAAPPAKPPAAGDAARPDPPSAGDERASKLLGAGNKAFREGRFADAEKAYREAFALKKGYDVAGNLGFAELSQGKLRECAQHLAFTLRLFPITGEPALREQMTKAFEQCRAGAAAIRVDLEAPGAAVLVDGEKVGEAPLLDEVFVEPGEHVVEARLDGFDGAPRQVTAVKGGSVTISLGLTPVPPPVQTVVHEVPARRRNLLPGLGLASIAVVGLVSGAAFASVSASKREGARALDTQILSRRGSCVAGAPSYDTLRCPTLQSTLRADDAFRDAGVVAFVAGSAAAVGTVLYFVWPQRARPSGEKLQVTPAVGARDGGLLVSGSF